ncbi:uncharacterized protein LOC108918823 isoform X2 [Scleropages formosus]|nr:uncharacterized protein LOC108918823 isoform X2 [Scleropages formosus]
MACFELHGPCQRAISTPHVKSDLYRTFRPMLLDPRCVTAFRENVDCDDMKNDCIDTKETKSCYGFPNNFREFHRTRLKKRASPSRHRNEPGAVTSKEAEGNEQELVEEEERQKEKAEKKRDKLRQKEKRQKNDSAKEKNVKGFNQMPKTSKSGDDTVQGRGPDNSNESSKDEEEALPSEFGELDLKSSFFARAAKIANYTLEAEQKPDKNEKKIVSVCQLQENEEKYPAELAEGEEDQQNAMVNNVEEVQTKGMQQAVMANQFAATGRFEMAVMYFTEAIKCNPKEFRFFGNRSFCYEKLQQYEKALNDADITLAMCPGWIKGYYRRGRALAGLKRYCEATLAFREVLKQDPTCTDAAQELMRVQIMHLMEMGFSREHGSNMLIVHGTVEKALEAVSNLQDKQPAGTLLPLLSAGGSAEEELDLSERKDNFSSRAVSAQPQPKQKAKCAPNQTKPDLFPIWVGCLVPSITESMICDLFSTAGKIHSVKFLPARRCAFVNYTRKEHCEKAIRERNGMMIEGTALIVRYPDKIHTHLGISKSAVSEPTLSQPPTSKKFTEECIYWRNNGCIKKERCTYKHVPEHKGIDRIKAVS